MSKAVGQDVCRKLADPKLADLFAAQRGTWKKSLVGAPYEPVLFEPLDVHALAVVDHRYGPLSGAGPCKDVDPPGACVERVCHKLFYGLVGAGVQPLGEQLDYLVAQPDVDAVDVLPERGKGSPVVHGVRAASGVI